MASLPDSCFCEYVFFLAPVSVNMRGFTEFPAPVSVNMYGFSFPLLSVFMSGKRVEFN